MNIKDHSEHLSNPKATPWHSDDGIYMSKQPSRVLQKMFNSIFKSWISLWFKTIPHCHSMKFSFAPFSVLFPYPALCRPRHTPKHCFHNRLCLTESSIVQHSRHRHNCSQWRCASKGQKPDIPAVFLAAETLLGDIPLLWSPTINF